MLWEASDRVCGKRLKALLPTLVPALERHGHVTLDPRVREQLMAVSAATIDRRLASARVRRAWLRVERMVSRARGLREGDGGPPGAGGRPCCSPQTHTNADLRARSTPRAAACSAPE